MPWGKMSQSVRAHAHHIISDLLRKKYINFSQQESQGEKTKQKTKQFHTFWLLLLYLVIGAVLPSGQNTP